MVNAFFRLRKCNAKTPQIIYVGLKYGFDQLIVPTGIKVLPSHWDSKKKEVKNKALPEISLPKKLLEKLNNADIVSFVNAFLSDLKVFINNNSHLEKEVLKVEIENYLNGRNETDQFAFDLHTFVSDCIVKARKENMVLSKENLIKKIDAFLHPPVEATKGESLFEYIKRFIEEVENGRRLLDSGKRYEYRSVQRFRSTQKLLEDFNTSYSRGLDFTTIDLEFYKDFNAYMAKEKDYKPDTMGKHQKTLKTFLREATDEGVNTNLDFQKKTFKITSKDNEESIHIALNEAELLEMYNLDLFDNLRLDRVRDLFLVASHTGLRFSDFADIKPQNIKRDNDGEFIEIIQEKMKRKVVAPINSTVKSILSKYNNELPEAPSNQKFNEYIKEVAQLCSLLQDHELLSYVKGGKNIKESVKRWTLVSSHTGRRAFATNAYERGIPVKAIMAITDHKTESSFLKYLKTSKRKQAQIFATYDK